MHNGTGRTDVVLGITGLEREQDSTCTLPHGLKYRHVKSGVGAPVYNLSAQEAEGGGS